MSTRTLLIAALAVLSVIATWNSHVAFADPDLPLPRVPISGDQDGSETPLVLRAPGFDLLRDVQTFRVPGEGQVELTFDFVFRMAAYNNEFGFFRVDNAAGEIDGVDPSGHVYLDLALDRAGLVFPSGSTAWTPDSTHLVRGGDILVFFIVQDSTLAGLRANNPTNDLRTLPLAFFSLDVLNPDSFDHFVGFRNLTDDITQFAFEDMTNGGDKDYDDIVYNVRVALRPSPRVEGRDIVFVRGLGSVGVCTGANEWLGNYLSSDEGRSFFGNVDIGKYLNYSYAGGGYDCPRTDPAYTQADTCDGVANAAEEVKGLINGQATGKVTIVGHSMGGLVAAYLVASDPPWAQSHIASVVTFDSPLTGIPDIRAWAAQFLTVCSLDSDPPSYSLLELASSSDVVRTAAQAGHIVPLYPLDATQWPNVIWREWTTLDGARPYQMGNWCAVTPEPLCEPPKSMDDDHTSIWARRWDEHGQHDKARLVGCAVVGALDCTFLSSAVTQGARTQEQMPLPSGTARVRITSAFGSNVRMTIISPNGTVYGPDGAGPVAAYSIDDVSEVYEITDPAPGMWTIELLGVDVAPQGEEVALSLLVLERAEPSGLYLPLIERNARH